MTPILTPEEVAEIRQRAQDESHKAVVNILVPCIDIDPFAVIALCASHEVLRANMLALKQLLREEDKRRIDILCEHCETEMVGLTALREGLAECERLRLRAAIRDVGAEAQIESTFVLVAALDARITERDARIAELERILGMMTGMKNARETP